MDKQSLRQLIISSAAYSLSSILGPLFILGLPAYFADRYFGTKPLILLSSVFAAFIITNVLLFKKVAKINRMISENFPAKKTEEEKKSEKMDGSNL